MRLDPHNCLDCPMTLAEVLSQFAIFIFVAFLGPWLLRRRAVALQALGVIAISITSVTVLLVSAVVPRWGVYRLGSETDVYPYPAVRLAYIIFIGIFFLVSVYAYRQAGTSRRLLTSHQKKVD